MKKFLLFTFTIVVAAAFSLVAQEKSAVHNWEKTIVLLDVKRKNFDYLLPWITPMQNLQKFGIVLPNHQILTTAEGLSDLTVLRIQKEGRGDWHLGEVFWVDHYANLALISSKDAELWKKVEPAEFGKPAKLKEPLRLARWRSGKLETRAAEFNQFTVDESKTSYVPYVQIEVSSEITAAGWCEALVAGDKIVGLTSSQNGNVCKAIPASFITSVLAEQKKGNYRGLGYFEFVWQQGENPETLEFLGLPKTVKGVIVIDAPTNKVDCPLQPRDVLLEVDGFKLDSTGDYKDPDYGYLSLENLATRGNWAGEQIPMKIWRNGKEREIKYTIPRAEYDAKLVPEVAFDRAPEYLVAGALVFQPVTDMYLRSWGADWRRRAPFRLVYYNNKPKTKDRPSLVMLSQVLPDPVNLGYQEYRYVVIDKVNGRAISTLAQLADAFEKPVNGFHRLEFMQGDSLQSLVLDASQTEAATKRAMKRYGIENDRYFVQP
jgi:hypothetical protein